MPCGRCFVATRGLLVLDVTYLMVEVTVVALADD